MSSITVEQSKHTASAFTTNYRFDSGVIRRTSNCGSSYTEGTAVLLGAPVGASLSWQNLYSHTGSTSNFTGNTSFTVPASTTVAALRQYLKTSSSIPSPNGIWRKFKLAL
jgi:hypothetical protein